MLGVPAHLLYSTSKEQSFASGLSEQVTGLQRFTLMPYTARIEGALSALLKPSTKFVEFDYKGLLAGTPENETKVLLEELAAGVISEEEVRAKLGYGPKEPTDTFHSPAPVGARGNPPLEEPAAGQSAPPGNGNGKMPSMMK
jgi:phage portal protein BeeE